MPSTLELASDSTVRLPADETTILVVDDSRTGRRIASQLLSTELGVHIQEASDGREALEYVAKTPPALIVTDLQMPGMDGLELMEILRNRFPTIPVILYTAHGSEELTMQALHCGATSYVPKRSVTTLLVPTVEKVLTNSTAERRKNKVLDCLDDYSASFQLENDPKLIPHLVYYLQEILLRLGLCDENTKLRVGVALEEALLNGLYHGNLEVSSELKLNGNELFNQVAAERRQMSPYAERKLFIRVQFTRQEARFTIRDEGPGFQVDQLPDPFDAENLLKEFGRGIVLIRNFMDEVIYNDLGNQITMIKRKKAD